MGSFQPFGYGLSEFASTSTGFHEWSAYPVTLDFSNSASFPSSTQINSDTVSIFSNNSSDQYSFSTAIPGKSPSDSSSIETDGSLRYLPLDFQENLPVETTIADIPLEQNRLHVLQEIETLLMAPETNEATISNYTEFGQSGQPNISKLRSRSWPHASQPECLPIARQLHTSSGLQQQTSFNPRPEKRLKETREIPQGDVRGLLIASARAISENRLLDFEDLIKESRKYVSITGEPIQCLGAYMVEGLVARNEASSMKIYRSLKCWEPQSHELLSYMQILYDICPYFKFGYMAANGAIADAIKNEDHVHIIDFQISQGTQWVTLIQALAAKPSGPPHVRITGIDDPVSMYARGDGLTSVGHKLITLAKKFKIPLEFQAMPVFAPEITKEMLNIRPGEAVVANFTLQLHHTPDESVDVNNPRDELLRLVKSLSPKVTTLVEQESNTNTTPFLMRFMEALDYYYAMFESIDEALALDNKDRINVEQHCLAKDIVNIIACEGKERVERHELLGKWRCRLTMAGFKPFPLSTYVNIVIKSLLRCYSDKYTVVEKDGAMLLGWKDRNLISASAWQ